MYELPIQKKLTHHIIWYEIIEVNPNPNSNKNGYIFIKYKIK